MSGENNHGLNFNLTRHGKRSTLTLLVNGRGPELVIDGKAHEFKYYRRPVYRHVSPDPDGGAFVNAEEVGIEYYDPVMDREVEISVLHLVPTVKALFKLGNLGIISTIGREKKFGETYLLEPRREKDLMARISSAYSKMAFSLLAL